jgi:hypothetical protein
LIYIDTSVFLIGIWEPYMKMFLSLIVGLLAGFTGLLLTGLLVLGARFGSVISQEIKKERRKMLQRITKNTIKESTPEQLTEMYYELVRALSMRSAQGVGPDEELSKTVAEVVGEMNARQGGGAQDLQLPPAA